MAYTYDYTRASFVTQAVRYEKQEDLSVKSLYPNAQEVILDTNLTSTSAASLASTMFTELKKVVQIYEVEVDGTYNLEDFVGNVPHFTLNSTPYATDNRTFKCIEAKTDFLNNKTILVIRG